MCCREIHFIRPIIIREKSVDELCRVINTLVEDVRSQMLAINLPKQVLRTMLVALDLTVRYVHFYCRQKMTC